MFKVSTILAFIRTQKLPRDFAAAVIFAAMIAWFCTFTPLWSQVVNPGIPFSGTAANNDCVKAVVSGGNVQSITGAGHACNNFTASDLTRTNDTNVSVTLSGTPTGALLQAVQLQMGWIGQLGLSRGGCAGTTAQTCFENIAPSASAVGDLIYWNGTHYVKFAGNSGSPRLLQEDAGGVPSWIVGGATMGTVTIAPSGGVYARAPGGTNCSSTTSINCSLTALGGLGNFLRGSAFADWQHLDFISNIQGTPYETIYSGTDVSFTASITVTSTVATLNVSAIGSGVLYPGQRIHGAGVAPSTAITAQLTGSVGGIGTYQLTQQTLQTGAVGSEAMTADGNWGNEGVYVIPVGGTTLCGRENETTSFNPTGGLACNPSGHSLTDQIYRMIVWSGDASRALCSPSPSGGANCPGSHPAENVTLSFLLEISASYIAGGAVPSVDIKSANTPDLWYITPNVEVASTNTPLLSASSAYPNTACTSGACYFTLTFAPNNTPGNGIEINLHSNALPDSASFKLWQMDGRQTPNAPIGVNTVPPVFEPPDVVHDHIWNGVFTRELGLFLHPNVSPGSRFTLPAFATSVTQIAIGPIPFEPPMRCDWWNRISGIPNGQCPLPALNVTGAGGAFLVSTGLAATNPSAIGLIDITFKSALLFGTVTGATAGFAGYVEQSNTSPTFFDSAVYGE